MTDDSRSLSRSSSTSRSEGAEESAPDRARADVGLVAALKLEVGEFLEKCDRVKKYTGGDFTVYGGFLRDVRTAVAVCGAGSKRAARAAHALLDAHTPEWMLSVGFAGGLTDDLRIGDIVVANWIVPADAPAPDADAGLKIDVKMANDPQRGLYVGRLATSSHIVHTVQEKREIAARTGAIAVDLESLAVAEVCRERKVKFMAIRAVSDDCSADLPTEVLSILGGTGTIRAGAVVGALWKRPSSYKGLWQLRQNAQLAAERLALFLAAVIKQMVEPKGW
jgi:adenosylhomocysteine nucleosidase